MVPTGISIIICTHNGSKKIISTLENITKQNIPEGINCELLIVDNASTDSTANLATNYWHTLKSTIPFRIIQESRPGKANALIKGYNEARYELMLLCDDDNWLQPDYIKTVVEIYTNNPEIGLLGGYGKALFEPGEKPDWFDTYQLAYVCGKHHSRNGFLKPLDYGIWGAGSVLPKKMWEFLRLNGFSFYHSNGSGKAMTEDAELSMAITFTGHRLYFDELLWFTHDLRGGRVTWKNFLSQQSVNGRNEVALSMYELAYSRNSFKVPFVLLFVKRLFFSSGSLVLNLVKGDVPAIYYYFNTVRELVFNPQKYRKLYDECSLWIDCIKNKFPLSM